MFSRIMPSHAPGGMQDHVLTLGVGLSRKGHAVTVVSSGRADGVDCESIEGVQVYYLPGTPPGQNTNAYWFGAADKLQALQPSARFEVLHSQSVGAYGLYRRGLNRRYRLPLVASFHGTHLDVLTTSWHTDFSLTNPLGTARFFALSLNLLFRYAYRDVWFTRGCDVVIATSDSDVWKYKKLYGLHDSQIRKVYNGIDTKLFSPREDRLDELRRELRLEPDEQVVLALARLEKDKGVQNAIAIMPRLLAAARACLIVVGDGDYRPALQAQARRLGVSEHVRFLGARPLAECARYFNLCDVFVDPTLRTDGYDLTIAEAMACAKPVIASDVGANSTLVDPAARNGILIPRGDEDALARELTVLLGAPQLRSELGANARATITARFSIEAMVDGMEHVYAELLHT